MANFVDLSNIRIPHNDPSYCLNMENILKKEPIDMFTRWFERSREVMEEPNIMILTTATKRGVPSCRPMMCKGFSKKGFIFFTNYYSRKGKEIEENPKVALTFYWDIFVRCVRIEGLAEKLPPAESDKYFKTRPYDTQIVALCSDQSKVMSVNGSIELKVIATKAQYKDGRVPRPKFWGGYIVVPHTIEFFQGQADKAHDRIRFRRPNNKEIPDNVLTFEGEEGWLYERLQP